MKSIRACLRGALIASAVLVVASTSIAQTGGPAAILPGAAPAAPSAPAGTMNVPSITSPSITNQPSVLTIPRERSRQRLREQSNEDAREQGRTDEKTSAKAEELEPL